MGSENVIEEVLIHRKGLRYGELFALKRATLFMERL